MEKIDIGRVVGRGFEVIGRQIGPFLLLGLLLGGIPTALMSWLALDSGGARGFGEPAYLSAWLVAIVAGFLLQATLVRSAILQLGGRGPQVLPSLINAFRLLLPMIGLGICTWFLTAIGFALLIVPGVIVFIIFIVSVPALVEEGGVLHAMGRSRELTRGSRRRIFVLLVLFVIAYLIAKGITSAFGSALGGDLPVVEALAQGLSAALVAMLSAGMSASLYLELRTAKEGATVDGLADIFA